jgi:hypothetical protein
MSAFPPPLGPFVRIVPVTIIVILSAPAWLSWVFLSPDQRKDVVQMVDALAHWTRGDPPSIPKSRDGDFLSGVVFARCDEFG